MTIKIILFQIVVAFFCLHAARADMQMIISAPPSLWMTIKGEEASGPVIELVTQVFSGLDIRFTHQALPWARAIDHIKSGQIDMIPIIFRTPERERFMEFSIPYFEVPTVVFVYRGNAFAFRTVADLKGKRGVMVRKDSISQAFQAARPGLDVTEVATYGQIMKMLASHRADYAVVPRDGFFSEAEKMGYQDLMEMLPVPIATRQLHFAFSKKSPILKFLPAVNEKIAQLKADGTIKNLLSYPLKSAKPPGPAACPSATNPF